MANKKITELPAAGAITGAELMEAVQGGVNVQTTITDIIAGAGGGGHVIEDEGTPLTQRADLNFVGAGVSVTDTGGKTTVSISGAAASAWDTTTAGVVERSTQAEAQNIATRAGLGSSSGQDDARAPSELGLLDMLIQLFSTAVTWVAKMTFTAAPRFNSTTASQHLRVDSNKDLVSVASSTQAQMITGTDDVNPATALSVESKRSITRVSLSNSATGSTNIDCGSKQELKVEYNTVVTGNITITLSNESNLEFLDISMNVTGSSITVTFPTATRMARWREAGYWNQASRIFTISSVAASDVHEFSLKRVNAIFLIKYEGPYRS